MSQAWNIVIRLHREPLRCCISVTGDARRHPGQNTPSCTCFSSWDHFPSRAGEARSRIPPTLVPRCTQGIRFPGKMTSMNRRRLLRNIAIGIFVSAAVYLGIVGIVEGNLVTIVWMAIVIPGALDWWNEQRDTPFKARPNSVPWKIFKLLYVLALLVGGAAIVILESGIFARIGGSLLVLGALAFLMSFYYARKPEPEAL